MLSVSPFTLRVEALPRSAIQRMNASSRAPSHHGSAFFENTRAKPFFFSSILSIIFCFCYRWLRCLRSSVRATDGMFPSPRFRCAPSTLLHFVSESRPLTAAGGKPLRGRHAVCRIAGGNSILSIIQAILLMKAEAMFFVRRVFATIAVRDRGCRRSMRPRLS